MLQDNQLDKDMKKTLAVMFCIGNTREKINFDKDIINAKGYLANDIAENNNLTIDQKSIDIKLQNYEKELKNSLRNYLQIYTKTIS